MRIAIDITQSQKTLTGLKTYADNVINELKLIDNKNKYFYYCAPKISKKKIFIVSLLNGLIEIVWRQLLLPLKLYINKIDLYYTPGFYSPFFSTAKKIVVIHDLIFMKYPHEYNLLSYHYLKYSTKISIKRADIVIATSKYTYNDILKDFSNINKDKIKIIYAAAADHFRVIEDNSKIKNFKEKYNLSTPFFLYAGGLTLHKNIRGLLKIFANFKASHDDFTSERYKLVLAGSSDVPEDINNLIKKLNLNQDIIFPGYISIEDLILLYNTAEMFLFPSLYEGFGIPPLEAMKCGCPVISSDKTSLPEVVGDGGILIDPKDKGKYVDAMDKILSDNNFREGLIEKGFIQAQKFSWKKNAQDTLNVFNKFE